MRRVNIQAQQVQKPAMGRDFRQVRSIFLRQFNSKRSNRPRNHSFALHRRKKIALTLQNKTETVAEKGGSS